jgi:hypothetical protein
MSNFPTIDPQTFQDIVTGVTGHQSSGGLVAAVGSLIAGNIASGIISSAVKGGALNVIDPLGLAQHMANGGATPAQIQQVTNIPPAQQPAPALAPAPAPAQPRATITAAAFAALPPVTQGQLASAGVQIVAG